MVFLSWCAAESGGESKEALTFNLILRCPQMEANAPAICGRDIRLVTNKLECFIKVYGLFFLLSVS